MDKRDIPIEDVVEEIKTPEEIKQGEIQRGFLTDYLMGEDVTIEDLEGQINESDLTEESKTELNKTLKILEERGKPKFTSVKPNRKQRRRKPSRNTNKQKRGSRR